MRFRRAKNGVAIRRGSTVSEKFYFRSSHFTQLASLKDTKICSARTGTGSTKWSKIRRNLKISGLKDSIQNYNLLDTNHFERLEDSVHNQALLNQINPTVNPTEFCNILQQNFTDSNSATEFRLSQHKPRPWYFSLSCSTSSNNCSASYPPFQIVWESQIWSVVQPILAIFSDNMSGFLRGHSCATTLIKLTDDWRVALDQKKVVGTIAIDLSKAFDSICHCNWWDHT